MTKQDDFFNIDSFNFTPWQNVMNQTLSLMVEMPQNFYAFANPDIAIKTQENTYHDLQNIKNPIKTSSHPMTIFDSEVVQKTLQECQKKWMDTVQKKPQTYFDLQSHYLSQLIALGESTVQKLQGNIVDPVVFPQKNDKRFQYKKWTEDPFFDALKQLHLLQGNFLNDALTKIEGLHPQSYRKLKFYITQMMSALSPTNFPMLNPLAIDRFFETGGESLIKGLQNFLQDIHQNEGKLRLTDMNAFTLGVDLATTKGHVVYQNELIQLIQYIPTTPHVGSIPLLIIPPWINKFYIFDLTPEKSFVKWATDQGLSVFIISWVNPDQRHAKKTLDDYMRQGIEEAIEHIKERFQIPCVNTLGYCAGGIPLIKLMARYGERKNTSIHSATLIVTPIDFSKMGDLLAYICEDQVQQIKAHMNHKGYLDGHVMMDSFNLLRPDDLIWSSYVKQYLLGGDPQPFEFLYWNCDAMRMPATMMGEYLEKFFLQNELMSHHNSPIHKKSSPLGSIQTPIFLMGAIEDHICPWRSVFPGIHVLPTVEKFILAGSGHVAGIFNHPKQNKYHFFENDKTQTDPNEWLETATKVSGSWWPSWMQWISQYTGESIVAKNIAPGYILEDAPGSYVMER